MCIRVFVGWVGVLVDLFSRAPRQVWAVNGQFLMPKERKENSLCPEHSLPTRK